MSIKFYAMMDKLYETKKLGVELPAPSFSAFLKMDIEDIEDWKVENLYAFKKVMPLRDFLSFSSDTIRLHKHFKNIMDKYPPHEKERVKTNWSKHKKTYKSLKKYDIYKHKTCTYTFEQWNKYIRTTDEAVAFFYSKHFLEVSLNMRKEFMKNLSPIDTVSILLYMENVPPEDTMSWARFENRLRLIHDFTYNIEKAPFAAFAVLLCDRLEKVYNSYKIYCERGKSRHSFWTLKNLMVNALTTYGDIELTYRLPSSHKFIREQRAEQYALSHHSVPRRLTTEQEYSLIAHYYSTLRNQYLPDEFIPTINELLLDHYVNGIRQISYQYIGNNRSGITYSRLVQFI